MKMNPQLSSSSPLPRLPIEVWGEIFKKIDNPLVLMKAQEVCSEWRQEINRILPHANWKKLCLSTIKESSLSSIVSVIEPLVPKKNYQQINDKNFWQKVFYHYIKCLALDEFPVNVVLVNNNLLLREAECITCCDIKGTWTIYGTNLGTVYVLNSIGNTQRRKALRRFEGIAEVKIWNYDTDQFLFLFVTKSRFMGVGYPQVRITLRGHNVCAGTANNLYYIQDNIIIKLGLTPQDLQAAIALQLNFNPNEKVVAINSCESKISVLVRVGKQLRIFMIEDESLTKQNPTFKVESIVEAPLLPLYPVNMLFHITLNNTIICIENNQVFLYAPSIDNWVTHDEQKRFGAMVTSVLVHGPCVFLGLSNGILFIYPAETIDDLLSSNLFKQKPLKMERLDTRPIVAIKVMDVDKTIHIIAFSEVNQFTLVF